MASKSSKPEQNFMALTQFVAPLEILPFGGEAAQYYGELRAHLEKQATPIGSLDMLIAAHELSIASILVTNNEKEFNQAARLIAAVSELWNRRLNGAGNIAGQRPSGETAQHRLHTGRRHGIWRPRLPESQIEDTDAASGQARVRGDSFHRCAFTLGGLHSHSVWNTHGSLLLALSTQEVGPVALG